MALTLDEVMKTRRFIRNYLPKTPLYKSLLLSELFEADVYIKYENHGPICSFKGKSALPAVEALNDEQKNLGIITASSGNFGQGVAFAGRTLGVDVTVFVPKNGNNDKIAGIKALGAIIIPGGKDSDEAKEKGKKVAEEQGKYFLEDGRDIAITKGTGTIALEIFEDLEDPDLIIAPVGNGALINGIGWVAKKLNPDIRIVGAGSTNAPSMYLSWKEKRPIVTGPTDTFAEGISIRVPVKPALDLMLEVVDDYVLVTDEELAKAIVTLFKMTHNIAEPAGAASLAAALKIKETLKRKKVVLILSGGNITIERLKEILNIDI
ncbi:MAG: threonine ammonia-lyase [Candidatus Hodarchaeales archaeon]